jgi:hypothetical protein
MGHEKTRVTGCFDHLEWQHILTMAMSERPEPGMLPNASKALRTIVRQHRLWFEFSQRLPYLSKVTAEQIVTAEKEPVSEPKKASGMQKVAQERKRA